MFTVATRKKIVALYFINAIKLTFKMVNLQTIKAKIIQKHGIQAK